MENLWKSIESERPTFHEDVLVYTAAGKFHVAVLLDDGEDWMTDEGALISRKDTITHWQPLAPPRLEQAAG